MFVEQVITGMDDLWNRLTADMDCFLRFGGSFLGHWDLFLGHLITSWWLRGRQEHQRGQLGLQGWIFTDFEWIWGTCWESIFSNFPVFSWFEVINFECQF